MEPIVHDKDYGWGSIFVAVLQKKQKIPADDSAKTVLADYASNTRKYEKERKKTFLVYSWYWQISYSGWAKGQRLQ